MLKPVKALYFSSLYLLISLIFALPALAAKVENLYTLSAQVADTSDEERELATEKLFRQLIVKVSGSQLSLTRLPPEDFTSEAANYESSPNFQLWQSLPNPSQLVNQFNYTSSGQGQAQELTLSFDATGVNKYIARLNLPLWGENRPKIMFWVAVESRNGRYLVTPGVNQPLSQVLVNQNELRGLPFSLPNLAAGQESQRLINALWANDHSELLQASQAYQADAVLLGKIRDSGSRSWQVDWQLLHNNQVFSQRINASNLRQALVAGSNFAAEELASRYASSPSQTKSEYFIQVTGISKAQDLAGVQNYLTSLSLTQDLALVEAEKERLVFRLVLQGGLQQFKANLRLDKRLQEEAISNSAATGHLPRVDISYRWN